MVGTSGALGCKASVINWWHQVLLLSHVHWLVHWPLLIWVLHVVVAAIPLTFILQSGTVAWIRSRCSEIQLVLLICTGRSITNKLGLRTCWVLALITISVWSTCRLSFVVKKLHLLWNRQIRVHIYSSTMTWSSILPPGSSTLTILLALANTYWIVLSESMHVHLIRISCSKSRSVLFLMLLWCQVCKANFVKIDLRVLPTCCIVWADWVHLSIRFWRLENRTF